MRRVYEDRSSGWWEKVNYYQEKTGAEIDFVVEKTGFEVKVSAGKYDVAKTKKIARRIGLEDVKVVSLRPAKAELSEIVYPFGL